MSGIEVVIKLGGCAITNKNVLETPNLAGITEAARIVKELIGRCVVVHGAGSFGHFQAHEYGTAKGFGHDLDRGRTGFIKTRLSVTKLLHIISEVFVANGVPAVGLSPCGAWVTSGGHVKTSAVNQIRDLLAAGFVPIIHGDCVLDTKQGCTILSGDKIIEQIVREEKPRRVVFLTNVEGIYDRPPEEQGASLLQHIKVTKNGDISVAISTSTAHHDVTGGVKEKVHSAAKIVHCTGGETVVFVAGIDSKAAYSTCVKGELIQGSGTKIFMQPDQSDQSV